MLYEVITVVLTQGGISAGYALMFKDGKPVFHYNLANVAHYNIEGRNNFV